MSGNLKAIQAKQREGLRRQNPSNINQAGTSSYFNTIAQKRELELKDEIITDKKQRIKELEIANNELSDKLVETDKHYKQQLLAAPSRGEYNRLQYQYEDVLKQWAETGYPTEGVNPITIRRVYKNKPNEVVSVDHQFPTPPADATKWFKKSELLEAVANAKDEMRSAISTAREEAQDGMISEVQANEQSAAAREAAVAEAKKEAEADKAIALEEARKDKDNALEEARKDKDNALEEARKDKEEAVARALARAEEETRIAIENAIKEEREKHKSSPGEVEDVGEKPKQVVDKYEEISKALDGITLPKGPYDFPLQRYTVTPEMHKALRHTLCTRRKKAVDKLCGHQVKLIRDLVDKKDMDKLPSQRETPENVSILDHQMQIITLLIWAQYFYPYGLCVEQIKDKLCGTCDTNRSDTFRGWLDDLGTEISLSRIELNVFGQPDGAVVGPLSYTDRVSGQTIDFNNITALTGITANIDAAWQGYEYKNDEMWGEKCNLTVPFGARIIFFEKKSGLGAFAFSYLRKPNDVGITGSGAVSQSTIHITRAIWNKSGGSHPVLVVSDMNEGGYCVANQLAKAKIPVVKVMLSPDQVEIYKVNQSEGGVRLAPSRKKTIKTYIASLKDMPESFNKIYPELEYSINLDQLVSTNDYNATKIIMAEIDKWITTNPEEWNLEKE